MPSADIVVSCDIVRTPRVLQMSGMLDLQPAEKSVLRWNVELPLHEKPWSIGLIVGPSGSGKSTIARRLFPANLQGEFDWPPAGAVVDAFPEMPIKEVVELLSSVGFSSPPAWVRPYHVLSTGEKFRASMARVLADPRDLVVVDEFTSVVDRTVAQIGSAAMARAVRRRQQQFIAVTCHEDVEEWLQPDWVYRPDTNTFAWRLLQRRPGIELQINRCHHSAWQVFHKHHYLSSDHSSAAVCFIAFYRGRPVAWISWLPFVGRMKGGNLYRRVHRVVTLPDYQGVGIGNALTEYTAALWRAQDRRAGIVTAHPGQIAHYKRNPKWRMLRAPSLVGFDGSQGRRDGFGVGAKVGRRARSGDALANNKIGYMVRHSVDRLTASFEYIGPALARADADFLLNSWAQVHVEALMRNDWSRIKKAVTADPARAWRRSGRKKG